MSGNIISWILIFICSTAISVEAQNETETESSLVEYSTLTEVITSTTQATTKIQPLIVSNECPKLKKVYMSQSELFKQLVDPCRYDKFTRPPNLDENGNSLPVDVYMRTYVFYMQNLDSQNFQFTLQMRFQIRYTDQRLAFNRIGSNRKNAIIGEKGLLKSLWMPHVFFFNEKSSGILGTESPDIITSIMPDGTVFVSTRLQVSLYCSMEFRKFPLDSQLCKSIIGSWIYNSSDVVLHWEKQAPFTIGEGNVLTEFINLKVILDESEISAPKKGFQYGDYIGNYSSISFSIALNRAFGYYLLSYYFPSMMVVAISWVSFWLQADQTSPRALLGSTTMLSFITLSAAQTRSLPKVSYIKASEVWFIGCTMFIFSSLVEFAFVNLLWRRRKQVVLKEITAVNILKQTLTPSMIRKAFDKDGKPETKPAVGQEVFSNNNCKESSSDSDSDQFKDSTFVEISIPVPPFGLNIDKEKSDQEKITEDVKSGEEEQHILTHQQAAILLDKRARLAFPCAFIVFNIFYWTVVNV